ncbi:hypothetical protein RS022_00500 [Candidatus Phytoplasma rubi]|uniref:Lipoprotein n=1 Tax=Candidatus Phytoplasma rubi TaxID=399025 RepID=A0ABY7BSB1_9MOLU|nr:hypothetical protein RS022_00500 [Candidatus Phytoplasma rubi]
MNMVIKNKYFLLGFLSFGSSSLFCFLIYYLNKINFIR